MTADEADRLFRSLLDFDRLVLAVSGGADSMALMHLISAWMMRQVAGPQIIVATVDHGLRQGSADEARQVGRAAVALGLAHVIKTNVDVPVAPFSQEWARGLRYRLLTEVAREGLADGCKAAIVTAHHADDQAETVIMRLARGSGIDGIGGMRSARELAPRISLVRPLLGVCKQRLVASLVERGATWIEDPSNDNVRFERVRLRERLQAREGLGLTSNALGLVAHRAARASEVLETVVTDWIAGGGVEVSPLGFVTIDWATLIMRPAELRLRVLARVLQAVGGRSEPVSLGSLEAITEQVDWASPAGKTIAHCAVIAGKGEQIHIVREIGRSEPAALAYKVGEAFRWDGRFTLTVGASAPAGATIRWLGHKGVATLTSEGVVLPPVPRAALATLPALWLDGRLLAVPGLGHGCDLLSVEPFSLVHSRHESSNGH